MSGFLLDTCAISEVAKPRPNPGFITWLRAADPDTVYLSVFTLGEIRGGVDGHSDRAKAATLETWLTSTLPKQFAGRILPFDVDLADRWGRLIAQCRAKGISLSPIDGLIAATALHHNLSVVTRNDKDFVLSGVGVTKPWI